VDMATGAATPLAHFVDPWLADGSYAERSNTMNRQAVRELGAWLVKQGIPEVIERVDRKVAGRYCSEHLGRAGVERDTANRKRSNLTQYWRWLIARGHAEDNPWVGQGLRQGRKAANDEDDDQRPYTEAELVKLFAGDADETMRDLMLVGALSGMRLDEACRLTVADCANGVFSVKVGKTKAARRIVPVHPLLSEVVERRCQDAARTAYLFHEFGEPRKDGSRGGAASNRFNRYRRDQGVDDRPNGRRRSRVDFHSFRHWFMTQALRARIEERIVKQVVGHALTGVTLSIYFGGDLEAAKRECVEAVRLPEAVMKLLPSEHAGAMEAA
jgi:integrase